MILFSGLIGYPSDDINKFLWMVRIGGGVFPQIKEADYLVSCGLASCISLPITGMWSAFINWEVWTILLSLKEWHFGCLKSKHFMFDQVYIEDYQCLWHQIDTMKIYFMMNLMMPWPASRISGASASVAERRAAARAPHKALVAPVSWD